MGMKNNLMKNKPHLKFSTIIYDIEKLVELNTQYDMLVFSHLRWNSVFQRPQHLLTHFSKDRKILFIEESVTLEKANKKLAKTFLVNQNIRVLTPYINKEANLKEYVNLIKRYINKFDIYNPVLWFYTPAFADVIPYINHSGVVYDCMDQLSNFKFAPKDLNIQEKSLIKRADIVFTGGKSLYEDKKKTHPETYCFPSSVDKKHFNAKNIKGLPRDLENIKNPIVLFYGVIDERVDLDLLEKTAKLMPNVAFVMIGPVVKIAESDLPVVKNLHYLGQKNYGDLPKYLKAADIAMMPFLLNDATRYISPTKTLEYMAAFKPIVSTAVPDVVRDYKKVISIIKNELDFKRAIEKYLKEDSKHASARIKKYRILLNQTSWASTAKSMNKHIERILKYKKLTEEPSFKVSNLAKFFQNTNSRYTFDL
jgi:glycosyltransferase involved in cell wall biosynthesis